MKKIASFIILITVALLVFNCDENYDVPQNSEVQNFIWKGLNAYYLWQDDVPDLKDNRFSSQNDLNNFVAGNKPEDLFDALLFEKGITDKWSWIVSDYVALEQLFAGVRKNNGMDFQLKKFSSSSNLVFGFVRYVLPNSDATTNNIKRGDIIYGINGSQLTLDNYQDLLSLDTYTVNFGTYTNSGSVNVVSNGIDISLTKEIITENPVHTVRVHNIGTNKIGYLFYNQFVSNFDSSLNQAFLQFKNENISHLVLDLRYNGGGSVRTAVDLASMITGQYANQLFAKEKWNAKWQEFFEAEHPNYLINNFNTSLSNGELINSLNLPKVTIIVTEESASASELVINGLKPYINVVLVGKKTRGKYVGSVTLYDSDNFRKDNSSLNKSHQYAMQPLVLEIVNKLGENDKDGFDPDYPLNEDYSNLGILGDINEPLFAEAISEITGLKRNVTNSNKIQELPSVFNSKSNIPIYNNMYVELK